jgi:hypothetical protein
VGREASSAGLPILLGADVSNYSGGSPPLCYGPSILYDYGAASVRARIRDQLAAMRAAGLWSLRVFLTYDRDASENAYFVPAEPGRLIEPFRTNLIDYLSDIRRAGFIRVTLAFDARASVDPDGRYGPYNPATFDAVWGLIRDTRPLLKQFGPADTRVDLLNEGAPSDYLTQQGSDYLTRMYANYVDAFGANDVTVSAGYWPGMQHLIDALRASGKPLPRWFDLHPRWEHDTALADLRQTDAELSANGLAQPLVIGEEKYNDPETATAVTDFIRSSSRPVEEVMEWPAEVGGGQPSDAQTRCIDPPYQIGAYALALNGAAPPRTLTATLTGATLRFRTIYGQPVSALETGRYTVLGNDGIRTRGFFIDRHHTSARFRGAFVWSLDLSAGTHTFGATGQRPHSVKFVVLTPG